MQIDMKNSEIFRLTSDGASFKIKTLEGVECKAVCQFVKNKPLFRVDQGFYELSELEDCDRVCNELGETYFHRFDEAIYLLGHPFDFELNKVLTRLKFHGFFNKPASLRNHHIYPGGLSEHSFEVYKNLTDCFKTCWVRQCSPLVIALAHDLCKLFMYTDYCFRSNYKGGHSEVSVEIWKSLFPDFPLTEEEEVCILNHMGVYDCNASEQKAFNHSVGEYPNVIFTHAADLLSSTGGRRVVE